MGTPKTGRPAIVRSRRNLAIEPESQSRFTVAPYRVSFLALEEAVFPSVAANAIRGALGEFLRHAEDSEAFKYFRPDRQPPSGFADPPRPFVIRAAHLNGATVTTGKLFYFDVHCFGQGSNIIESFTPAFQSWKEKGLGIRRGRVQLVNIQRLGPDRKVALRDSPILIDLSCDTGRIPIERATVEFLTPTELKHRNGLVTRPEFPVLFARLRDRIVSLATFYGGGFDRLALDELTGKADEVRLVDCAIEWISTERRSSHTGQIHPLGGFTGIVVYQGGLSPFLPWFEAGYWTGVGRQTVWGKGVIGIKRLE